MLCFRSRSDAQPRKKPGYNERPPSILSPLVKLYLWDTLSISCPVYITALLLHQLQWLKQTVPYRSTIPTMTLLTMTAMQHRKPLPYVRAFSNSYTRTGGDITAFEPEHTGSDAPPSL